MSSGLVKRAAADLNLVPGGSGGRPGSSKDWPLQKRSRMREPGAGARALLAAMGPFAVLREALRVW